MGTLCNMLTHTAYKICPLWLREFWAVSVTVTATQQRVEQDVLFINLSFVTVLPSWLGGSCCRSAVYTSPSKPRQLARYSEGSWAARKEPFWGIRGPRESRGESPGCPRTATPDEEIVSASFSFIIQLVNIFVEYDGYIYINPQSRYDQTVYTVIKRTLAS